VINLKLVLLIGVSCDWDLDKAGSAGIQHSDSVSSLDKIKEKVKLSYQISMNGQAALLGQFSLFSKKPHFCLIWSCVEKDKIQH